MKTATIISAIILGTVCYGQAPKADVTTKAPVISVDQLKSDMRKLWEDHVSITHDVIISIVTDQQGIDDLVKQMKDNQKEMSSTIASYYGDEVGKQFNSLLYKNITLAADLMIATRKGSDAGYDKAEKKWQASADEIAGFLSNLNPSWKGDDLKAMIYGQQWYIAQQAIAVKSKDDAGDMTAYTNANMAVVTLADKMSDGIIHQFPERFVEFTRSYGSR